MSPVRPDAGRRPIVERPAWPRPRCASAAANGGPSSARRQAGARSRERRSPPRPARSAAPVRPAFAVSCALAPGGSAPAHGLGSSRRARQTDVASGPRRIIGRTGDSPCHDGTRLTPPTGSLGGNSPYFPSDCDNPDSPSYLWTRHFQRAALGLLGSLGARPRPFVRVFSQPASDGCRNDGTFCQEITEF